MEILLKCNILSNFSIIYASDLGTHIDGFIALVAHTVIATANVSLVVEGKKADVILAAYNAL